MHQLSPQEAFPIVYVLADPNDLATYYVRSVLRNSANGAIIQVSGANFVNLTDGGSRRFTKTIQAPNDPSGQGLWMDITTTVYKDSGYTIKSENYFEQVDKYLVQQRWSQAFGMGGGGALTIKDSQSGSSNKFTLEELKTALKDVLENFTFPEPKLESVKTSLGDLDENLSRVLSKTGYIAGQVEKIEAPDLSTISKEIVAKISSEIGRNKTKEFDPTPLMVKISRIASEFPRQLNYGPELADIFSMLGAIKKHVDELVDTKDQSVDMSLANIIRYIKTKEATPAPVEDGGKRSARLKS